MPGLHYYHKVSTLGKPFLNIMVNLISVSYKAGTLV